MPPAYGVPCFFSFFSYKLQLLDCHFLSPARSALQLPAQSSASCSPAFSEIVLSYLLISYCYRLSCYPNDTKFIIFHSISVFLYVCSNGSSLCLNLPALLLIFPALLPACFLLRSLSYLTMLRPLSHCTLLYNTV